MARRITRIVSAVLAAASSFGVPASAPAAIGDPAKPAVAIPFLDSAPTLDDFLEMQPSPAFRGKLAIVAGGFIQRDPSDGNSASQRTDVYLGYDHDSLYAVFVAHDTHPSDIRANLARRENIFGDDIVHLQLDTFLDERNAYSFICNPLGVQFDAIWSEASEFDSSYDTVWYSDGRVTGGGYVVWMKIPFKSLRFPMAPVQTWGLILNRDIPRNNEESFWPGYTKRIQGRLNQAGLLTGMSAISPGRNLQFIPYVTARSFRISDSGARSGSGDRVERGDTDAGIDAKFVFQDRIVLDATFRPDFSQVESDEPQVTVNQRFEVFFPEKRPFFLENATYFDTPFRLLFTRRIAEPKVGARVTGKVGPYSLGMLLADDEAPGKVALPGDPDYGKRAQLSVLRVNRDLFEQSSLGFFFTDRRFAGDANQVGAMDGRLKWNANWDTSFQMAASVTRSDDGTTQKGAAYRVVVARNGLHFHNETAFTDIARGFRTELGFVPRADLRQLEEYAAYTFRPEGKRLLNWGPELALRGAEAQDGTHLEWRVEPGIGFAFRRQTRLELSLSTGRDLLRPEDCERPQDCLAAGGNLEFPVRFIALDLQSEFSEPFQFRMNAQAGDGVNFVPPPGRVPFQADVYGGDFELTFRPARRVRIDASYLFTHLSDPASGSRILVNEIERLRVSIQVHPRLSLRLIGERESLSANPLLASVSAHEAMSGDFLFTYLVNPWTAVYAGWNGTGDEGTAGLPADRAHQLFVKLSYLFRL